MNKWIRGLLVIIAVIFVGAVIFKPFFSHKPEAKPKNHLAQSNRTIVTVTGTVSDFRGYDHNHNHEYLLVDNLHVKRIENGSTVSIPHRAFVAIRIDQRGTHVPIYVHKGDSIELKGEFIPYSQAYKTKQNCCDAVIHFTHHPIGYVFYHGKYYE
jgi:hypothetical protein